MRMRMSKDARTAPTKQKKKKGRRIKPANIPSFSHVSRQLHGCFYESTLIIVYVDALQLVKNFRQMDAADHWRKLNQKTDSGTGQHTFIPQR